MLWPKRLEEPALSHLVERAGVVLEDKERRKRMSHIRVPVASPRCEAERCGPSKVQERLANLFASNRVQEFSVVGQGDIRLARSEP